jgi:hypothetical protein
MLTACINPGHVSILRNEASTRRADYKKSLRAWLSNPAVHAVVFCENSNADLSDIHKLCDGFEKSVELLSFNGQDFPPERGRGYGEMKILRHALAKSTLISQSGKVIKVTGRLYVPNIGLLMPRMADVDVICEWRRSLSWTDSRMFCATREFIEKYLLPLQAILDDSKDISFEICLSRAVHRAMADGGTWSMFPFAPIYEGISGGTIGGQMVAYPTSKLNWLKRELFRRAKELLIRRA